MLGDQGLAEWAMKGGLGQDGRSWERDKGRSGWREDREVHGRNYRVNGRI